MWKNQISTSKKFKDKDFEFVQFRVAIYILLCIHITIDNINIENSNGTGMYNVAGNVVVTYSTISETKPQNDVGGRRFTHRVHLLYTWEYKLSEYTQ